MFIVFYRVLTLLYEVTTNRLFQVQRKKYLSESVIYKKKKKRAKIAAHDTNAWLQGKWLVFDQIYILWYVL